jgi:hypothetical protein
MFNWKTKAVILVVGVGAFVLLWTLYFAPISLWGGRVPF